ncbi:T9SS type A sorting domain-containing protein [Pedobacter sp. SD-b]|uniref:T9SS type A sorting domain-containing protein n=1 Tax=Pedobacter segetis TaxID=2793069 RepID=A0ABS1BJ30_9SPHI|nr:T9SS type A sorting domain-containing protein [Pedobacter segetis]MBK0382361.1 T9SS type A sorting domain-containing protein [Pedobacter segetis]
MKKLLLFLMLFAFATMGFAQTATDGDYRSKATGNWSDVANWQIRTGGTWATASTAPTAANNVYIQDAHVITIDVASVNCKDLDINITGGVAIGTNTLNVSGKIRAFSGTADVSGSDGTYAGTSSTATASGMISNTLPGILKFIGATRNITETGEWNSSGTTNDAEFALNVGAIGTLNTGIKFKNTTISSGTVITGSFIAIGSSEALTIKSGATLITSRSGASSTFVGNNSTTKCGTVTIENGATLELTGSTPTMDCTTFNNNGKVVYSKAGTQTFLSPGSNNSDGAILINNYYDLVLINTSTKTASTNFTVNNSLVISGTATLSAVSNICTMANGSTIKRSTTSGTSIGSTSIIQLGTQATDLVNIEIGSSVSNTGELPSTQAPGKIGTLTVNSGVTYTITGGRTITNLVNNGITALTPSTTMTLVVNGNISGTGTITGNTNASLSIGGSTGGNSGTLVFTSGSQNLNNLIMDRTGANSSITIGSNLNIVGNLSLNNGMINIAPSQNLTLSSTTSINGGSSTSYLNTQTSGANVGKVLVLGVTASKSVPVGSTSNYLPVTLNPAASSDFSINVFQGATNDATPNGTALSGTQKADLVDAIYNIARTSGTGNCDVTLGWDASLEGSNFNGFADAGVGVAQYTGSSYGTFTGPGDNTANTITTTVSSFAPFLVGKVGTLPVKLISFTAKAVNQTAVLNWRSTSEVNLSKFDVQRSSNGVVFETIGSINANNKAGIFDYSFTDKNPAFGANYYRLLSTDLDGTIDPSAIQAVNFGSLATLSVYPNPTKGLVNLQGLVKGDLVIVTDLVGRTLISKKYDGENAMNLNLDQNNSGVYLLSVSRNGKITSTNRIVKN